MNSPYMGKFKVTNTQTAEHDGLDLVGIDSKEIHATVSGSQTFDVDTSLKPSKVEIVYKGWHRHN